MLRRCLATPGGANPGRRYEGCIHQAAALNNAEPCSHLVDDLEPLGGPVKVRGEGWVCLGGYSTTFAQISLRNDFLTAGPACRAGVLFDLVPLSLQLQSRPGEETPGNKAAAQPN
jgi:hypothetical protein